MKEKTQTDSCKIVKIIHLEIYAFRCKELNRLLLHMTFQAPGMYPVSVDIDLQEWRRRRKSQFGKLIGFYKRENVTSFFYEIKKLSA